MVTPVEQLRRHFVGDQDFTTNFLKFVGDTIKDFNNKYFTRKPVQFVISALRYNVKNSKYSVKHYDPAEPGESTMAIARELADSMTGFLHPYYCVGYMISADGWVSKYDLEGGDAKEQEEIMGQLEGTEDPFAKEMIIHTIVSISGVRRMNLYEIKRADKEIRNSGISDVNSTLQSALTELFTKAEEAFTETYNDLSAEDKEKIRLNIFE